MNLERRIQQLESRLHIREMSPAEEQENEALQLLFRAGVLAEDVDKDDLDAAISFCSSRELMANLPPSTSNDRKYWRNNLPAGATLGEAEHAQLLFSRYLANCMMSGGSGFDDK